MGAFSLFAAVVRYWFIVNNATAKNFGEEKASKIFAISYCVIPLIMAALNSISNGTIDQNMWVNQCWTNITTLDNPTDSESESGNGVFCNDRQYDIEKYVGKEASNLIVPIMRAICGSVQLLYLAFFSNIAELVIYGLIFKYLNG